MVRRFGNSYQHGSVTPPDTSVAGILKVSDGDADSHYDPESTTTGPCSSPSGVPPKFGNGRFATALKREKDGSLVTWLPAVTMNPKPEWPYGMLFQGYGSKEAGEIPAGVYRLEVYAHNELVGQGRFSVR